MHQARVAGLLGSVIRDLAPFKYQPRNERYGQMLEAVMGIFDREQAGTVPVKVRIEAADALGQAGDPRLEDDSLRWVDIPGGRYLMGAQKDDRGSPNYDPESSYVETPHWVEIEGFRIARWPVTVQDYALFVEDEGYTEARWWAPETFKRWPGPRDWENQTEYPNRPVVNVSWYEASAYCAWLVSGCGTLAGWKRAR